MDAALLLTFLDLATRSPNFPIFNAEISLLSFYQDMLVCFFVWVLNVMPCLFCS